MKKLAEMINGFFTSLCENMPPLEEENRFSSLEIEHVPDQYIISVSPVERQLAKLKTRKAPDPKDFSHILVGPVSAIWNSSIREGKVHQVWKSAYVSPLPKASPAVEIRKHLRPISLTPQLSKGLEFHIVRWLWDIFKGKIDDRQFGTVKGSSTTHALVEMLHTCYDKTDASRNFARILLLDYTKAFDLINHHILLDKLESLGTPNILLRWIADFLTQRSQQVKIGQIYSEWATLRGGVPQGTLLGPVLFIVMINDLHFSCTNFKYVDDTNVLHISNDPQSDILQSAATHASNWSRENNMQINASKTKELRIDFGRKEKSFTPLHINEVEIECVDNAKILGLTVRKGMTMWIL